MHEKRKNHIIPAFYLTGFAKPQSKRGQLFVLDVKTGDASNETPKKCGYIEDFYRIEAAGLEPAAVEDFFGKIENAAGPIFKRIAKEKRLPAKCSDEMKVLMAFLGQMLTRTPSFRRSIEEPLNKLFETMIEDVLSSKETYEWAIESAKAGGKRFEKEFSYEEMKDYAVGLTVRATQDYLVANQIEAGIGLVECLLERDWKLLCSENAVFACSDRPSSVHWIPGNELPAFYSPGAGLQGTEISFPLNKKQMLVGRFPEDIQEYTLSDEQIGRFNFLTTRYADHIYAENGDFVLFFGKDPKATGNQLGAVLKANFHKRNENTSDHA